jgi:putative ubiquitin-RnfH superfamily antitoxin RatB of RatAB toxin-antitoxin module
VYGKLTGRSTREEEKVEVVRKEVIDPSDRHHETRRRRMGRSGRVHDIGEGGEGERGAGMMQARR